MCVLATRRLSGPAFEELEDVEVASLAELTRAPSRVRIVANLGVGYDRIDVAACRERGIIVTNTPGVRDAATADLAFALLLAARRRVVEGDRLVRSGSWKASWSDGVLADECTGSTLGIVGLGRIGRVVARRARAFELRVLYTQRTRVETDLPEFRELDTLLVEPDLLSLHVPATPETCTLIDARRLTLLATERASSTPPAGRSWTSRRS